MAKQFNLRIQFDNQSRLGRPKNKLSKTELQWLDNFFERPDITYITPGRKEQKYLGRVNGEGNYAQKKYLLWTLAEIVGILNGLKASEIGESFPTKFSKVIKFQQLYQFIKSHPEFVFNKNIPQSSCLCEICENVNYISKALSRNSQELPNNPHDLVQMFSCDSNNKLCMYDGDCDVCRDSLNADDFKDAGSYSFYQWQKVDEKIRKSCLTVSVSQLVNLFNSQIRVLKKHIYVKREQNKYYNKLNELLKGDALLLHVDYSENYANKEQQEIQSAYFGCETFLIFTACCYI